MLRPLAVIAVLIAVAGCGHKPQPTRSVKDLVQDRSGYQLSRDCAAAVDSTVSDLLSRPLSADTAVRIALLNNRNLAMQLQEVGIAQADYITASQIKNPAVYVDFRLPDRRPPGGNDIEASATEDVLDILLLPLRKKLAQQQLDQSAIRSADASLQLVCDVRTAFYTFASHQQDGQLQQQLADASAVAAEFAQRQHQAGNINDLEYADAQANSAEAQLQLIRTQSRLVSDREKLNELLGLSDSHWTVASLETLPPIDPNDDEEIATAEQMRLDLEAYNGDVALAEQSLKYTNDGLLTAVNVGASMERQSDGQTVVGPALSLELPIFNQHQGQISRAQAEVEMAKTKRDAALIHVRAQVRIADAQVKTTRAAASLANDMLVPEREKVTLASQERYNGMLVGLPALLAAKQSELTAKQESIDALADYWIARAELQRAVGR